MYSSRGDVKSEGEFSVYELPGGKMAKIVRTGPYGGCEEVFNKLYAWIAENGYEIAGNSREVYLNSPMEVSQEELITEIYIPVK